MAEVIRMPLLSDTMTEGKIVKWNKNVGDKVKSDDVLADVETDKATMEVVGYADGTLLYVGVKEGDAAKVNEIIAIVGKEGEEYKNLLDGGSAAAAPAAAAATPAASPAPAAVPCFGSSSRTTVTPEQLGVTVIRMPLLSDTMTEGKIVQWNKKVGDKVKSDDNLADVETDKATMEVVGYAEGTLLHIGVKEGEAAKVNSVIAIIGKEGTDISGLLSSLDAPALTAASCYRCCTCSNSCNTAVTAATAASTGGLLFQKTVALKPLPLPKNWLKIKVLISNRLLDPAMVAGS